MKKKIVKGMKVLTIHIVINCILIYSTVRFENVIRETSFGGYFISVEYFVLEHHKFS